MAQNVLASTVTQRNYEFSYLAGHLFEVLFERGGLCQVTEQLLGVGTHQVQARVHGRHVTHLAPQQTLVMRVPM